MDNKKLTRGGSRPGAGRHKSESTKVITTRVKISQVDECKKMIKEWKRKKNSKAKV